MIVQEAPASCISVSLPSNNNSSNSPSDEYTLPPIHRTCLNASFSLARLGKTVRLEIAQLEDIKIVHRFIINEFGVQEPLNRALGISEKDLDGPIKEILTNVLPQSMSVLVVDQGVLCGVIINSIEDVDRGHSKEPTIRDDYGDELEIDNGVSPKLRYIYTILGEIESFLPNYLCANCTSYLKVEIISVRPEFSGCGLGRQLMLESFKLAHARGVKFCAAICTAISSTKISKSLGLKQVFSFPYSSYKDHGKPVFFGNKMYDGSESSNLMIGDLDEILQKYN